MAPKHPYVVDVLNRKQKRQVDILIVLWAVSVGIFTAWWFRPKHIVHPWLFATKPVFCSVPPPKPQ